MDCGIRNKIINSIKSSLTCLQERIYDVKVQNDSNNKQKYCFDLYEFYSKNDLFRFLISKLGDDTLLYRVFNVKAFETDDKVHLNTDDFDYPKDNPHVFTLASVKLHEIKLLSKVISHRFYICTNINEKEYIDDYNKVINVYLEYVDSFNSKYFVKIDFDYYNDTIESELLFENLYVESKIYAIRSNDILPLWIEYLINSFALYGAGNKEMAFFVAFASLDNFIEILNNLCIDAYRNININEMSLEDISTYYNKYNNYKNANRRLIGEKLKTVLDEIYNDDDAINKIYNNFKDAEKKRDSIAHCSGKRQYEEGDYENLIINYLNFLYKLKFEEIDAIFNFYNDR